jgi:hypothetical protein
MQWEFIVALVVAIPIILFPVAFVWYLNIGGIYSAIRRARAKKAAHAEKAEVVTLETAPSPRIREVQVFRKTGAEGIAAAMEEEASKTEGETKEQKKANVRQSK